MLIQDVYQILTNDDKINPGDEFTLTGLLHLHIWGKCDTFVGRRISDLDPASRASLVFRRWIARDELRT